MAKVLIRVTVLLIIIGLGFTVAFPEWLEFKDKIIADSKYNVTEKKLSQADRAKQSRRIIKPPINNFSSTVFPDKNFRACVKAKNKTRPEMIEKLDCSDSQIKNLQGIERLKNLKYLDVSHNQIEYFVSLSLMHLVELNASHNHIAMVAIESEKIRSIDLSDNQIRVLDLGKKHALERLNLFNNQLIRLTFEAPQLQLLDASKNEFSQFDLNQAPELKTLVLRNNQLTSFDFNNHNRLMLADLRHNKIQTFKGISDTIGFKLFLHNNPISRKKENEQLLFSKVKIIYHDLPSTIIPDPMLRDCLVTHMNKNIRNIESITHLSCHGSFKSLHQGRGITNTTGLSGLNKLKSLRLTNQNIEHLELSHFAKLTHLNLNSNQLKNIDLSTNPMLEHVSLNNNNLRSVYIKNEALTHISLANNALSVVDFSEAEKLTSISLPNNQITDINIANLQKLHSIDVRNNRLSFIDISNTPNIKLPKLKNNPWSDESFEIFRQRFWPDQAHIPNEKLFNRNTFY